MTQSQNCFSPDSGLLSSDSFFLIKDYYPFGSVLRESLNGITQEANKFKFIGKERDLESGYDYVEARYYDPALGRFVQVDPLFEQFQAHNPYHYSYNNPIRFNDLTGMAPGDPGPGHYVATVNTRTIGLAMRHPFAAMNIGTVSSGSNNISTVAVRFSTSAGLNENALREGSQVNAFRHTLWQSSITSQYDASTAAQAGNAHEAFPFAVNGSSDPSQQVFQTSGDADQSVDLLNNSIGRDIGSNNSNLSTQELAIKVLDTFKNEGLWTSTKQEDGTYKISKTKITDEQYKSALEKIKKLDNNGNKKKEDEEKKN